MAAEHPKEPDAKSNTQAQHNRILILMRELLNQPDLQPEDDFFASGGDSILAIQLASRARAIDIPVSVSDIFAHSCAAALAENFAATNVFSEPSAADHEQQHFVGKLRPQPIQQWFFEQAFAVPEHWNQAVMLSLDKSVSFAHLCEAVQGLITCHDALRLSVKNKGELYIVDQLDSTEICQHHNLSEAGEQWQDALAELSNLAQASFSFDGSPLLQLCHIATPDSELADRLLVIAHHLLVDGVSWRILLADLELACTKAKAGQTVTLPPASASLDAIAFYLQERACDAKHLDRWQGACATARYQQALGASLSDRASKSVIRTKFQLSETHTRQLLNDANRAYKSNIQTLLLSAWQWSGLHNYQQAEQVVLLESHGRAKLYGVHDASRTIGWLTALFPLRLHSQNGASDSALAQTICVVKEQLAWATEHGCEFGALRYSHPDPKVRTSLTIDTRTQVFFNYLGQLDTVLQQRGLLGDASEPTGAMRNELDDAFAALQITAAVTDGRLSVTLECASGYYTEQDALRLSAHFEQAIETVRAHCLTQTENCPTPSDFALLPDLDRLQLQQLLDKAEQPVADIYPMTPLQQGMWFHARSTESPVYREQSVMLLQGALDTEAFEYAWTQLLAKHSILRTAFFVTSQRPVQLVLEYCKLPLQIDEPQHYDDTVNARLALLAEQEYRKPIDLNNAPCMRLRLVPFGEHCHGFIWTYHHMIMDGWSLPVLFDGLIEFYQARIENRVVEAVADPFRDYVAYLETRDTQAEKAFWQTQLGHIDTPTLVTEHLTLSADKDPGVSELTQMLSTEFTQQLNQFAKHQGLTLNQVIQGAWAYWLRTCCQSDTVLFGQTISGRPDTLPNVEQRVGLYINTQPVLVSTPGHMSVKDYLRQIKEHQAQLTRFAHTPLSQIHQWSGIDNSSELFDALYVFENYPNDPLAQESAPFRVKVCSEQDQTHYPITFVVGVADQLSLTLSYSEAILTNTQARQSLNLITDLLDAFMAQPEMALAQLPLVKPEQATQIPHFELPGAQTRMDQHQTLHQAFAQIKAEYETCPAIRYIQQSNHTEVVLSYGELDEAACQLANYLSSHHSLCAGQAVIAVCLDSGPQLIIAILAALKLGASYLPIAPALPEKRRHYMLTNAQAAVLIGVESAWVGGLPACPVVDLTASHAAISAQSNEFVEPDCNGESACYVIYTSGTTGEPKGVQVAHRSVLNYVACLQSNYAITPDDNYLQFASCSFDVFAEEVFCTLLSGATLVMAEQEQLLNSQALAELSRQSQLS